MCNGKCVSGVGAADVVDYAAAESQNAAVGSQNEAVRRAEGQVTFAAKVTLPFAQRSRYRLAKGQATVSEIDGSREGLFGIILLAAGQGGNIIPNRPSASPKVGIFLFCVALRAPMTFAIIS